MWSAYLYQAWLVLRDDRHYGAMGGLSRIYYRAIRAYAQDHAITGGAFDDFLTFITAMDDEYVAVMNERSKAEAEKQKQQSNNKT